MGPAGTGKSHALGTLVDYLQPKGVEVFLLALERGYSSTLGYWTDRGLEVPENFHWHSIDFADGQLVALLDKVDKIGKMSQEALHKLSDPTRGQRNYVSQMLKDMQDFPDDRTGKRYGDVSKWGMNRVFVIDGLTGLCRMAMSLVIGNKPVRNQADWGISQDIVEPILWQLCDGFPCHFILLAHVEREVDQVSGGTKVMVSALGKALAPKIGPLFDDVILTVRNGTQWTWSTANPQADLKTRNLPVAENLKPDFSQIYQRWEQRGGRYVAVHP